MRAALERLWYGHHAPVPALSALARIYGAVSAKIAAQGRAQAVRLPVPVIVVGNITVGGTGKTPLTIWLVEMLRGQGWQPGVISRGYGGHSPEYPLRVTPATDPARSGDEPALIARRLQVPVAVAPDRVAAAQMLLDSGGVDILVADDGLQHYRLARDLEICVIDGGRGLGNGALLPAGPLREPPSRLHSVDLVVVNGGGFDGGGFPAIAMTLRAAEAAALGDGARRPLASFAAGRCHAVAGIGNPQRFFASLRAAGVAAVEHPFPDHHRYTAVDLAFGDDAPVLMTEKDAVKCTELPRRGLWAVPVDAVIGAADAALVQQLLERLPSAAATRAHG